jgi:hypothetical protein
MNKDNKDEVPVPNLIMHYAMKTCGNGCIDPCFLDLGLAGREWSASRPGRFTHG